MTQNVLQKRGRIWLSLLCVNALMALLLVSIVGSGLASRPGASAGTNAPEPGMYFAPRPWTTVGSTGTVDEGTPQHDFANYSIGMSGLSTLLTVRYNVTNTFHGSANPNLPGWQRLEMASFAPPGTSVTAQLYEVKSCSPSQLLICTAKNVSNNNPCATCLINPNNPINFANNLYYVEVTMQRPGPNTLPRLFTLRLL
jgi:hypothetical protein